MTKKSPLEERWDAAGVVDGEFEDVPPGGTPAPEPDATPPPVVNYGIHLMMMSDGRPAVQITGEPSYPEILRLMDEVSHNMRSELTAERVVAKLKPLLTGRITKL